MFFLPPKDSRMQPQRREDGVVLVEFALVLPLLLLLVFGFLFFGLAMNAKIDSTHLTAEGARYIAVNQNPGADANPPLTLQQYILTRADTQALRDNGVVCVQFLDDDGDGNTGEVGDPVRVTLNYNHDLIPFLSDQLAGSPGSLAVASEATMRLEALPTDIAEGCTTA